MMSNPKPINKVIYHKGDVIDAALSSEYDMFIHGCNCMGVMGGGVALQVRNRIPKLYQADQDFRIDQDHRLGMCSYVGINETIMANLYTQYIPMAGSRQLNYGALASSLNYAVDLFIQRNIVDVKICLPRIGCGLAGGNWEIVEEILAYFEFHCNVEFHVYDF